MRFRPIVAALLAAGLLACGPVASAQTASIPPRAGRRGRRMQVTDSTWNFSSNLPDGPGPWGSVTVTNTNCTTPYRPGTAQAGAAIFTAPLSPAVPAPAPCKPFIGSSASGQVKLLPMADTGGVNVRPTWRAGAVRIGTTLTVCLTLGVLPPLLADINVGQQRVAATNFDVTGVTTATTDAGQPLIAISGTQTTAASINRQWVFFFLGDEYLGTDTLNPSLASLQLVGSPGQDQIDVTYSDPGGGAPETITYTLSNGALEASNTPPGH